MFGTFSEQLKKSAAPLNSLMALNAKTLETLSGYQTSLFTGLLDDSTTYLKTLSDASDINHMLAAQSECAESMRDRLATTTKDTYHTLNQLRDETTEVVRTSLNQAATSAQKQVKETVKSAQSVSSAASNTASKAASGATKSATATTKRTTQTAVKAADTSTSETAKATTTAAKSASTASSGDATTTGTKKPASRAKRTAAKKSGTTKSS
ncbi:TIGR01841 family phasin [Alteromonas halophila]|uniref:Phasin domain-containing protein n=1 Tax=Alteromonas halophila TaxID=516698 RepID=A0A918MXB0_9ALTE|nr:TIGR01841 family phasin [Alteromonas halophila]GGW78536.1 hypothetical protein GCM10007391_08950 [Alteromonas halophila]